MGGGDTIISVTLAGVEADLGDQSDDAISVRADHGTAGTGHVVLTANSGALVTRENGWTYLEAGNVASIEPAAGQLNSVVTISGARLFGGGSSVKTLTIQGVEATIREQTDDVIVAVLDASTGNAGDVVTLLSESGATINVAGLFA